MIRQISQRLDGDDWSLIDLILKQYGLPTNDQCSNNKGDYIVNMIETGSDDILLNQGLIGKPRFEKLTMKESDIRQPDKLAKYLELSTRDAEKLFSDAPRNVIACPGCEAEGDEVTFKKNGFGFVVCSKCSSLFQSPRPLKKVFEKFYMTSESSDYWATEFFPPVAEVRREKIFRPRVEQIQSLLKLNESYAGTVIDVEAGHGIFLEEWAKCFPQSKCLALEPGKKLATIRRRRVSRFWRRFQRRHRSGEDEAMLSFASK